MRLRTEMPVKVKAHTAVFHKLVCQTDNGRFDSDPSGRRTPGMVQWKCLVFSEQHIKRKRAPKSALFRLRHARRSLISR